MEHTTIIKLPKENFYHFLHRNTDGTYYLHLSEGENSIAIYIADRSQLLEMATTLMKEVLDEVIRAK